MSKSRKCRGNVLFKDDLNESLHDLHKKVRDISFEQEKLADQFNTEKACCMNNFFSNSDNKLNKKCSSNDLDSSVS
jgi:hypothetical protein